MIRTNLKKYRKKIKIKQNKLIGLMEKHDTDKTRY